MNSSASPNKSGELQYGQFFIDWLNTEFNFDYKVVINNEENSDTDVFGISKNKERLNLQIVSSNGPTLQLASQNKKSFQKGQEFQVLEVNASDWTTKAVTDKLQKFYSNPEQLIIIIEGFLPTPTPEEVEEIFTSEDGTPFRGVYYVSLPVKSSTNLSYETNGYVVTIKDAFNS